jgi:hypothetical protein
MRQSTFTEERIIAILREHEAGSKHFRESRQAPGADAEGGAGGGILA